jgi:parvulin-like peptidyl-prolyl isomerase
MNLSINTATFHNTSSRSMSQVGLNSPQGHPMEAKNYFDVTAEDVVHFLKKQFQYRDICRAISSQRLIDDVAQARNLQVSAEEIQQAADDFRHANGLEHAADTVNWLQEHQMAPSHWEENIHDNLLMRKLSGHLFAKDIDRIFAENRANYESAVLYQLVVPYEQLASELFYQIEESEISFYEAAHLYDIDVRRRQRCGFEGIIPRWKIEPQISPIVFGAQSQQVTEPFQLEDGYHLIWVEQFLPAELTEEIQQDILNQFFQNWLQSELNHARHR